jgi:hypothetical protein
VFIASVRERKTKPLPMKTKIFFLSIAFVNLLNAQSPNFLWTKSAVGTALTEVNCICTDTKGNEYITGSFQGSVLSFGATTLTNSDAAGKSKDIFIVKYDGTGNVLWAKSIGGAGYDLGYSISADTNGNVNMTGHFNSPTLTAGATTLANTDATGKSSDIVIARYDATGNLVWIKSIGGSGDESGRSICTSANGNSFITGYFSSKTINFGNTVLIKKGDGEYNSDAFIAKIGGDGNVVWAKSIGGLGEEDGSSISADGKGNVFITGHFKDKSITIGATTINNAGGDAATYDIFLAKYDDAGNALWAKSFGGSDSEQGSCISTDGNGNVIMTGYYYSTEISFATTTLKKTESYDVFVAKYDAAGNELWAKSAAGNSDDEAKGICTDANGNILLIGYFSSQTITFGGTTLTNTDHKGFSKDIFIAKYDATGNLLWAKSIGGSVYDYGKSIAPGANGNVFFTGLIESPTVHCGTTVITNTSKCVIIISGLGQ